MQGIDIFDMKPLDASRVGKHLTNEAGLKDLFCHHPLDMARILNYNSNSRSITGTFEDPIVVRSAGEELQCGCTGCPADSHVVRWAVVRSNELSFQKKCHTDSASGISTPTI
jgi:hypothetical protein